MATLGIDLHADPVERVRADVAVVTVFASERPLRGSAGRADWRLCGELSELAAAGRLEGRSGEALLVTTRGGLRAPLLVVLGLGPRGGFDAAALRDAAHSAVARSLMLGADSLVLCPADLPLLPEGPDGSDDAAALRARVETLVTGAAGAICERDAEVQLSLVVGAHELVAVGAALRKVRPRGLGRPVALRLPAPASPRRGVARAQAVPRRDPTPLPPAIK